MSTAIEARLTAKLIAADIASLTGEAPPGSAEGARQAVDDLLWTHLTKKTDAEKLMSLFLGTVGQLWKALAEARFEKVEPARVAKSATVKCLTSFLEKLPLTVSTKLKDGGRVISSAISTIDPDLLAIADVRTRLFACLDVFAEEVVDKKWGVEKKWCAGRVIGDDTGDVMATPLSVACIKENEELAAYVMSKHCEWDGSRAFTAACAPAAAAFAHGMYGLFDALLDCDLDVRSRYADGRPLVHQLAMACTATMPSPPLPPVERRLAMFRKFLEKYPEAIHARLIDDSDGSVEERDALAEVVSAGDAAVARVLLEAKAPLQFNAYSTSDGRLAEVYPTMSFAFMRPSIELFDLLVKDYGAFERWEERYNEKAKRNIARSIALLAAEAYPKREAGFGRGRQTAASRHTAKRVLDAVLASGFNYSWDLSKGNAVFGAMLPAGDHGPPHEEDDCLAILRKFKAAGFNVAQCQEPGAVPPSRIMQLSHLAAGIGSKALLDFAISEVGCDAEAFYETDTNAGPVAWSALTETLRYNHDDLFSHLLVRHKVKPCYPGRQWREQPISIALSSRMHQTRSLRFLRQLLKADTEKQMLTLPCYRENTEDLTVLTPI